MQVDTGPRRAGSIRVLITSELIYPHIGGVENSVRHLASEAVAHGDEVLIVASDAPANAGAQSGNSLQGVPVRLYRSFHSWPQPLRRMMSFWSALSLYRGVGTSWRPDVVLVRYHLNVLAAWMAGLRGIRYLVPGMVRVQNSAENRQTSRSVSGRASLLINSMLQRWALAASDRVLVFSRSMATQATAVWPKATVDIVAPGVDTIRFPFVERTHSEAADIVLLCVGRLVAAKGVRYAIEALRYLPANFVLNVVGDGEDREELEQLALRLGVAARVKFVGETAVPEVYYRQAQIYLMASVYEPFGQTIIEAAASGLPIVAFSPQADVQTATFEIMGHLATYADNLSARSFAIAIETAFRVFYVERTLNGAAVAKHVASKYSWAGLYEALTLRSL